MKNVFEELYTTPKAMLNDLLRERRNGNLVFRGISRTLEIKPNIQRVFDRTKKEFLDLSTFEYSMLDEFYRLGRQHFVSNYDLLDYVATAQHFGLPTRLIDWTRDPFVALFFAVFMNDSPDNEVYRIFYADLDDHLVIDRTYTGYTNAELESASEFIIKYMNFVTDLKDRGGLKDRIEGRNSTIQSLGVQTITKFKEEGLLFYDPPLSNPRLSAQQGLFSIVADLEGDTPSIEIERYANSFSVRLSKDNRDELLLYLKNMNYTMSRLFPDLSSISSSIILKNIASSKT